MPLSEEEQRILHEIEAQFYEQDPAFAKQVASTTPYTHAGRNLKWSGAGFVAGLILMLVSFASSLLLGVAGFALMFVSAVIGIENMRAIGRAGWNSVSRSPSTHRLRTALGDTRRRLRGRFRRDSD